ncbi:MAG: PD40 domain-containing protein [Actinobacteria bacterium]|nr:PD40 domain-containing protein [Actinomycetota bacterium]
MLSRGTGRVGDDALSRRWIVRASLATGALFVLLLFGAPLARATTIYAPVGSVGPADAGPGQFVNPQRVAVDPVTGDVFVADSGNDRIQVFRPAAAPGSCAEACATYLTSFGSTALTDEPIGVAVDPETGDVYVSAAGTTNAIVKFRPDVRGDPTSYSQVSAAEFTSPSQGSGPGEVGSFGRLSGFGVGMGAVAVDPAAPHDLLVADPGNRRVERFGPEGAFIGSFDGVETTGGGSSGEPAALFAKPVDLAVDATGDVYVADLDEAANAGEGALRFMRFDAEGVFKATLAPPRESNPNLSAAVVGVESGTAEAFLGSFFIFSPSEVHRFGSDDQEIDHFRCIASACESPLFGIAAAPASSSLSRRLYVVAADGFFGGTPTVQVFEAVELPGVSIAAPGEVSAGAATFHGSVDPNGSDARWRFEYRATGSAAWTRLPAPDGDAGSGTDPVDIEATTTGLEPNTTYEVRLVASKGEGDVTSQVLTFTTLAQPAAPATGGSFSVTDTSATLSGTVAPRNSPMVDCHFEVGTTIAYGRSVSCSAGDDALDDRDEVQRVVVGADAISFLIRFGGASTPPMAYGEPAGAVEAALDQLPTIGGVGGSVSVTGGPQASAPDAPYVVAFEGTLGHRDVEQLDVSTSGAGGLPSAIAVETIHPGGDLAPVAADVPDLQPGTTYHFRLVADNGVEGWQSGADRTFTTRAAAETVHPPRHYELVSAADTNGIEATPDAAAVDGEAYAYSTFLPTPPDAVSGKQSVYVARRNPDGTWTQRAADLPTPPQSGVHDVATSSEFFSDDLSSVAITGGNEFDPDDRNGSPDTYLKQISSGKVTWLSRNPSLAGPQTNPGAAFPSYISADGRTVIFSSDRSLLPVDDSDASTRELYQWREGVLSLVSLVPTEGDTCGGSAAPCIGESAESSLGSAADEMGGTSYGAVSQDGARIVFEAGAGGRRLFVRLDGERTVAADASAPGAPALAAGPLEVNFSGADSEVRHVFFTSSSPLTPDSSAPDLPREFGGVSHQDLYDFDVEAGTLRDLTPFGGGAGVERVYAVSGDGRRIYFTARGQLVGRDGVPGGPNLYLAEVDGTNVRLRFVATIDRLEDTAVGGLDTKQAFRETAANADGSVLAFRDRLNAVPGRRTGGFPQVFVYDADRDELSCPSCPGDGSPAGGPSQVAFHNIFANGKGSHFASVSEGGAVVFESPTALLGSDSDGVGDVYEWRGGTLALISAGTGGQPSGLAGAAGDGSTVFFASADQLVPAAQAGIIHIYAARVGPAPESETPRPPCSGEDCRSASGGAPPGSDSGTAAFGGPGNVQARRCPRGRRLVHRGGATRCAPKHGHRAKRRPRRHHGRRRAR